MIVPSIDIMGGRAVQLRRGKEFVLTAYPVARLEEFSIRRSGRCRSGCAPVEGGSNAALIAIWCAARRAVWVEASAIWQRAPLARRRCRPDHDRHPATPNSVAPAARARDRRWTPNTARSSWTVGARRRRPRPRACAELSSAVVASFSHRWRRKEQWEGSTSRGRGGRSYAVDARHRGWDHHRSRRCGAGSHRRDAQVGMALYTASSRLATPSPRRSRTLPGDVWPTSSATKRVARSVSCGARASPWPAPSLSDAGSIGPLRQALWIKGATSGNTQQLVAWIWIVTRRAAIHGTPGGRGFCHLNRPHAGARVRSGRSRAHAHGPERSARRGIRNAKLLADPHSSREAARGSGRAVAGAVVCRRRA